MDRKKEGWQNRIGSALSELEALKAGSRREGSGSSSKKEFIQFLNIARRSTFENANILILLQMRDFISEETLQKLLDDLDKLCRQITNFQNTLK